ncbi:MAG: hypothetical protein BV457_00160 [Thermoplasmata archaeon M9B1D]|nr:MAG: hypothetical protein BV457_00160 [Thermoplasmata archaeon M9B1D]PNX52222.1 MAG: hypothetical protein BV456_00135 [Thermoplasmata archaeon M8B2D]
MLTPKKKEQKEIRKKEIERIALINILSFKTISEIRRLIRKRLKPNMSKIQIRQIEKIIISKYFNMFKKIKKSILNSYNQSSIESKFLIENTLKRKLTFLKIDNLKKFPTTYEFRITNHILSNKSILKRSKNLALRTTKIIENSLDKGFSIEKTTKLLDIEFGFRDRHGKITRKTLNLLKEGKLTRTNGHIYRTYRIARTESMRMASLQQYKRFEELKANGFGNVRIQMISTLDNRTRPQSIQMNKQISTKNGTFKYPNGQFYKHGLAPAKWSINDRETTIIIFL